MDIPPNVKLPSSLGGFVLIFHVILFFFLVFYNCNYKPTSFIFSFAISGIIIGLLLYYQVEPILKQKYPYDLFERMHGSLGYLFAAIIVYLLFSAIIRMLIIKILGLP